MSRTRLTRLAISLAVTGLLLAACASGGGGSRTPGGVTGAVQVTVVNASSETIFRIFMSPSRQRTWGPDHLGSNVLARGASYRLSNVSPGRWDIRIVDRSGNYKEYRNQNFRAGRSYTLRVNAQGWHPCC